VKNSVPSAEMNNNRNPILAAVLSFFFIGWGQWYNGKTWDGVKFFGIFTAVYILMILFSAIRSSMQFVALIFTAFLFLALFAIWISGIYDAYTIAKKINNGEEIFAGKSQLFWLPAIILALAVFVILLAIVAAFIFGMAGATS
jgi:hypothetical protein